MNGNSLIKIEQLCKYYKNGTIKALDGIDLEIYKGEVVVIIGPSGSGKSTFLRSMNLLELPTAGTITFEGVDITDPKTDINKHRQRMGMVFQHFNLFPNMNVLKNMTVAPVKLLKIPKDEAEKKARALLEKSDLVTEQKAIPASSQAVRSSVLQLSAHCVWSRR